MMCIHTYIYIYIIVIMIIIVIIVILVIVIIIIITWGVSRGTSPPLVLLCPVISFLECHIYLYTYIYIYIYIHRYIYNVHLCPVITFLECHTTCAGGRPDFNSLNFKLMVSNPRAIAYIYFRCPLKV